MEYSDIFICEVYSGFQEQMIVTMIQAFSPKEIIAGYFHQLTHGCDCYSCTNHHCRSSPNFSHTDMSDDPNEVAYVALTLAQDYGRTKLCKGVSLYHVRPSLKERVEKFDNIMNQVMHKNLSEANKAEAKLIINDVVGDPYAFPYIFKNKEAKISIKDLLVDDDLAENLLTGMSEYMDIVDSQVFFQMVNKLLDEFYPNDLYQIRSLMLLFSFRTTFITSKTIPEFVKILQHIFDLPADIFNELLKNFGNHKGFMEAALNIAQSNFTVYLLAPNETKSHKTAKCKLMARFLNELRVASQASLSPLPARNFSNDIISNQLDVTEETSNYLNDAGFSYISIPAVLNLEFKSTVLQIFHKHKQQSSATQNLLNRVFQQMNTNLSQRDLSLFIEVSRENIVEDTLHQLSRAPAEALYRKLLVVFTGEQGVDAGGVSREFFYLLCNNIFDSDYGMFTLIKNKYYWFNSNSLEVPMYYKLLGTLVSIAIYNSVILPIHFPGVLYKKLRHQPLTLFDLAEIDEDLVNSFLQMRQMKEDGQNIEDLCLTFSISRDNFGVVEEIPIMEDGIETNVTNDNLELYIEKYSDWILNKSVEKQFINFEKGFNRLCSHPLFNMFTSDELDILVSGQEVIYWEQLMDNTKYIEGYNKNSKQVKWFWEIFKEMSNEQKEKFLRFSTGCDRVAVDGKVQLIIQKTNDETKLPVSHTCFNIFALPTYKSKEIMKEKILTAIEYNEGFGLI